MKGIFLLSLLSFVCFSLPVFGAQFTIGSPVSPTGHGDPITFPTSSGWYAYYTLQRIDAVYYLNYGWNYSVVQYDHNLTID